jgi:hypothetical protein
MTDLGKYLREQAAWRRSKAEEYPEDERNVRSAEALDALAEYVDERPNDVRVRYLTDHHLFEAVTLGGEETHRQVARWGFHRGTITAEAQDAFLSELCALAAQDAYELIRDNREDYGTGDIDHLTDQWGLIREDVSRAFSNEAPSVVRFSQKYGSAEWLSQLEFARGEQREFDEGGE